MLSRGLHGARTVLRWSVLSGALLIAAASVLSLRWTVTLVCGRGISVSMTCAALVCEISEVTPRRRIRVQDAGRFRWDQAVLVPLASRTPSRGPFPVLLYVIPGWILLTACAAAGGLLWRLDRRPRPGYCRCCGYDLRANVSGRCPECGATASGPTAPRRRAG